MGIIDLSNVNSLASGFVTNNTIVNSSSRQTATQKTSDVVNTSANATGTPYQGTNANSASNSASSGGKTVLTPILNPLGAYDQSTYSIKFSIISDNAANNNEVVIVETGKTNLNIQSLKFTSIPGNRPESRNTFVALFEMRIFEAYGANLPDLLIAGAKQLGVQNYLKSLWKITIKFQGFDSNTGLPVTNILGRDWSWLVQIDELFSKINESGATHTIKFHTVAQIGYQDQFAITAQALSIDSSSQITVGEVLQRTIDQMNANAQQINNGPTIVYKLDQIPYTHPYASIKAPFDHKVGPNDYQKNSQRNSDQITTGVIKFMDFVNNVFAASPTAVVMAAAAARTPDNNETKYQQVVSTFHLVESRVTLGTYNPNIRDYNKIITYVVRPFETVRIITNTTQARDLTDQTKNSLKTQFLVENQYLSKVYNFIFTGKNTEVLKFDMNLSFGWFMAMDKQFGSVTYGSQTQPQVYNNLVDVQGPNTLVPATNSAARTVTTATSTSNSSLGASSTFSQIPAVQSSTSTASPLTTVNSNSSTSVVVPNTTLSSNAQRLPVMTKLQSSPTTVLYVDDLNISGAQQFEALPVSQFQDTNAEHSFTTASAVEADRTKQRSAYGMLLDQLYGGGNSQKDMLRITITIRGDPYWLGRDPATESSLSTTTPSTSLGIGSSTSLTSQSTQNTLNLHLPDPMKGEICFILRVNIPQGVDENTGTAKLVESEMYTGFYWADTIENDFQDGSFTQTITANRILGMNVPDLISIQGAA